MMFLSTAALAGLLLSLSGFEAIVHLTQEKIMNVNVGQDVKILCRRDDSGSWSISWYQQKAGETPKFVLADATRASGLSSRFTYTDNGLDEYLNIARVEAEDEAVYYCGCIICDNHHSAAWHGSIGGGTELKIARGSSPPSLLLLAPSGSLLSESDVSVMCVAQGFYPEGVTMSWSEDSSSVTGDKVQTGPYQRQADGTFSQTSVLKLSKQRWSSGRTYTCRLSHSALSTPLSQSTSLDQCM
ncbi:immunoglobulin kappa light chain-like [Silurus meridionalis]|uniref:immunoglobulin kappa light chain-like n=1 Tax=Silurus meridionalis TaxID=175797 RepID=UPI001EEAC3DD|nr:immunoglobulin kappa light chain-like [Silurus meridionalis]